MNCKQRHAHPLGVCVFFSVAYWQQEMMYGIEPEFGDMTEQGELRRDSRYKYWKPNMPNKDVAEIQSLINHEAKTTDNYLGIDVKWMYNKKKGHEYFAFYSVADDDGLTMLYASKDDRAEREYALLEFVLQKEEAYDDTGTGVADRLLDGLESVFSRKDLHTVYTVGAGSNRANAAIYHGNTRKRPSKAFINCFNNIIEVQSSYGLDDHYQFAVDRGDLKTAQRMVDEAAKTAGYTEEVFHGMGNRHNVYQSGHGQYGDGVYFTYDQPTARGYGKVVDHLFVKSGKIANYDDAYKALGKTDDQTLDEFANTLGFPSFDEMIDDWANDPTDVASNPALIDMLMSRGFEGFIDDGNSGFVLWDRNGIEYRIKSADPVTYDDNGNVIPLSKRFDSTNNDIRYSDRDYSYDALSKKPDMVVTTVGGNIPKNRADIVAVAKKNAASVGRLDPKTGSISVHVKDIGRDVGIGRDGLKHSIDRRIDVNAPVLLKAGEIISNSIRINELTPKKERIDESYVLIGAARNADNELYIVRSVVNRFSHNLVSMDVLYAINAKKRAGCIAAPIHRKTCFRYRLQD